jgi:hypothetical protein
MSPSRVPPDQRMKMPARAAFQPTMASATRREEGFVTLGLQEQPRAR